MISILTPALNEALNLEALHARIIQAMEREDEPWEWLIVDDHSRDETFAVIQRLALLDVRVRGLRLARNSGSHVAITCGLHHVRGDAAVMMAGDLQDPPETMAAMLKEWRGGAQVVWAKRRQRPGARTHAGFASFYYWIMRHVVGMKEMPAQGADFFLVDRVVLEAFRQFGESNVSVLALITWIGFRQTYIDYDKQPRTAGRSGWTLAGKIKLVVDSITGFSDVPIRACSLLGVVLLAAGTLFGLAGLALLPALRGIVLLVLGAVTGFAGLQMLALGIVGEYVWRALDEARRRPQYLVEGIAGRVVEPPSVSSSSSA